MKKIKEFLKTKSQLYIDMMIVNSIIIGLLLVIIVLFCVYLYKLWRMEV